MGTCVSGGGQIQGVSAMERLESAKGLRWMSADEVTAITVPFSRVGEALPSIMQTYGVAIVTDVFAGASLEDLISAWHQDLLALVARGKLDGSPELVQQTFNEFMQDGPVALPLATSRKFAFGSGFVVDRCLAHGRFAWTVRTHGNVHKAFKALHGDVSLVSSIDVPFFTPEDVGQGPKEPYGSAHVDQNVHDSRGDLGSIKEYQGVLYAWPCREEDQSTATVVWPRSYIEGDSKCPYAELMKDESAKQIGRSGSHYTQLGEMSGATRDVLKARFEQDARRVPVPAGGLLLWNSKTIHTGAQRGPRLAQAVCLEPADRRSDHERLAKLRLAALGLPSMHWASHGIQHDCVRLQRGCLTQGREVESKEAERRSEVLLPLSNSIQPWCTKQNTFDKLMSCDDVDDLIMNVAADEEIAKFAELLESCVVDEAKAIL